MIDMEKEEQPQVEEEEEEEELTGSLFPVFSQPPPASSSTPHGSATTAAVPDWLQNQSFTTDLSVINRTVSSNYQFKHELDDEEEGEEESEDKRIQEDARPPQYDLVDSSPSDKEYSDSDRERKKKRKKKKRRKRLSDMHPPYASTLGSTSRKPDVRGWASSSSTTNSKEYYFDSHGDRDNLAFGSLYRMDVARYKLCNAKKTSNLKYYRMNLNNRLLDGDVDVDVLDDKLRAEGRYWSGKYVALERHRNLKRMRIIGPRKLKNQGLTAVHDFIPLSLDERMDGELVGGVQVIEESWEDEMFRRTREFNVKTRERPHDEHVWMEFAAFQDKVASMQPQRGARLQTLEKKISILEKATELNPDSEELVIALMNAYRQKDSIDVLIGRWEKILVQNSGSYKLWREFLRIVQVEFSRFKVSEMRKMYANAVRALSGACSKQHRQVQQTAKALSADPAIVELELGLVDIFLSLCRFEWQAGYQELTTALFQAEIEYSLFCPPLLLTEQSKHRLFEFFWNSNGARVGEENALGWSTWLEKEEEQRQKLLNEQSLNKVEEGGWTGWSEPLSRIEETGEIVENITDVNRPMEEMGDELEMRNSEEKDDTESLLKMLGIGSAAEAVSEIKDVKTWMRWSEEEFERDCNQWMPVREKSDGIPHGDEDADLEGDEQLSRVILYEDVSDYLFSLSSEEARLSLIYQFIDFYGGKIAQWTCTNSTSWDERTLSLESLPHTIFEELRRLFDEFSRNSPHSKSVALELLLSNSDDMRKRNSVMKFLRNVTLLCLTVFPKNYTLEEAALVAEELSNTQMNSSNCSVTPCRALAKSLLKSNRQDLLLCGVYARREAEYGNIDHARKVFDMALASAEGLPLDSRSSVSLLYLWYAEMEVGNVSSASSETSSRALHILSCLGSGVKYSPFKCQPSSLQQLRARQGFKERIRMLHSSWSRGLVDDYSVAFVCSAALFEELTTGLAAGVEIMDQAFTMVLPERRRHSNQLEVLFNYYVKMLYKHVGVVNLSKIWDSLLKGLEIYPSSPHVYDALTKISHLHTSPNKLRLIFDEYSQRKPSVVSWLFALSYEMSKGGSPHRIRGIFERALESDKLHNSVVLWRCYIAYENNVACNYSAARRVFFRAIHACPWSKRLWLDGFLKLNTVLTAKELSDLQEVMRDKELNLRTDIYEILLQDEMAT